MNPKADFYFQKNSNWQKEILLLRDIVLDCGLEEMVKWGCPCYMQGSHNIVLIHVFKDYCALLFFKGALLKDESGILVQQTRNVQAARQLRFTSLKEVRDRSKVIKRYVHEAIEVEKAGLKVPLKKTKEFDMPDEFKKRLDKNAGLKKAFGALTPGRQRAYLLHFSGAKLSATRESRIDKAVPQILNGKGLDD